MKSKLLILLLAIGFLPYTGANATKGDTVDTSKLNPIAAHMYNTAISSPQIDPIKTFCGVLTLSGLTCAECSQAKPDMAKLTACVIGDENVDGIKEKVGAACDLVCGPNTCNKIPVINPNGDKIAAVCKAVCCPLNSDDEDVKGCMASAKLSCPGCNDKNCEAPNKCVDGTCTPPAKCKPACKDSETCVDGKCVAADKCAKVKCPADQTCDPDTGKCKANPTDKCAKVKCPDGQACDKSTGKCVAADKKCTKACSGASVCDRTTGTCVCGPNKIACKEGDTCKNLSKGTKCCNLNNSNCYQ